MIKWRYCPELVQLHGFRSVEVLLDTPPRSSKNCPEAKKSYVRVQISLSRPVSFFMVKPRLCPRQDQSSPLQSCRQLGFGQVFSDQPAAYRQRTLWVMINWLLTCFHAGSRYLEVGSWQEAGSNWVTVWIIEVMLIELMACLLLFENRSSMLMVRLIG